MRDFIHVHKPEVLQYFNTKTSFKITVETYNKHFTQEEKIEKIESFNYLPLAGRVNLKTPDVEWWYIEFWGLDPKTVPTVPEDLIFGRLVCCRTKQYKSYFKLYVNCSFIVASVI